MAITLAETPLEALAGLNGRRGTRLLTGTRFQSARRARTAVFWRVVCYPSTRPASQERGAFSWAALGCDTVTGRTAFRAFSLAGGQ
jgi:hypothetical protein